MVETQGWGVGEQGVVRRDPEEDLALRCTLDDDSRWLEAQVQE